MNSPHFVIAGDVDIPEGVTRINLITGLSRYDFATIGLDEDDDKTLFVRRVDPEELAAFKGVLFQADSGDEENMVVLRQVSLLYWPFDDDEEDEDESGDEESESAEVSKAKSRSEDPTERGFTVVSPKWWEEFTRKHRRG